MSLLLRPARFPSADLTPPVLKPWDVVTTLADFAIVTYAVNPEALARHLAPGFEPDVFTLDNGQEVAFVSAVPFRDLDFRFVAMDGLRFKMGQTNYRAYVRYQGERVVWFFGTSLTMPWVLIPSQIWSLPWHAAQMKFDARWQDDGTLVLYQLHTKAHWGAAEMELVGSPEPLGRLDGFMDEEETAVVLTHPLAGYFYRRDGQVGSYSIWHDKLNLKHAHLKKGRFAVFEQAGLITPDTPPHSVLVQRETEFTILLPPKKVE